MRKIIVACLFASCCAPQFALAGGMEDYKANCVGCHGTDGNARGVNNRTLQMDARKLALKNSRLDRAGMIAIIKKGKGHMPGYDDYLAGEQISDIADYLLTLRDQN